MSGYDSPSVYTSLRESPHQPDPGLLRRLQLPRTGTAMNELEDRRESARVRRARRQALLLLLCSSLLSLAALYGLWLLIGRIV